MAKRRALKFHVRKLTFEALRSGGVPGHYTTYEVFSNAGAGSNEAHQLVAILNKLCREQGIKTNG